jgi:SAM-dependent methyltransferase
MISFDPVYTRSYYDKYGSRESTRWDAGARAAMQGAIIRHHLRQRVHPNDRVLDAGSGPGTFAKDLVELGAHVTCLDISPIQLAACQLHVPGCDAYIQGSVTDLSQFAADSFDVVVALGGVVSYCFDHAPIAVHELVRVTRPDGWVGMSVMNLFGTIHSYLPGVLNTDMATNEHVLRSGDFRRTIESGHEYHLFRVRELRELLISSGLRDVELFATGWVVPDNTIAIPDRDTDAWRFLFEVELEASQESPGAGTHILAWGRVP